ncbi:hypothetical protein IF1G_11129 [Cordyceps javanica]|uniref:Uncharacterized protein n=1 Tax=Cordyceps javanica TaxID=43265 RepID=A0A545VIX2_9HYPO|nr:hypothetical protein IF1G_11129 [Cordyceps javanica]TQW01682.1 hypothetical protein IF2G_10823 [Cordyceps javanica]
MAVETGGTSEKSVKRKATAKYFYLEIEGHYECCALLTKPSGKCHSKCRLSSVPCCPGRVSHAAVRHMAAVRINDEIEPGYWSWTDQGPRRLDITAREGSCEEKRAALMAKMEPRHSNLKDDFDGAKAEQNSKLRTQSFQRILEVMEVADDSDRSSNLTLEQDVLFTCHGETFERTIRDGIAKLRSASPEEHHGLFCQVISYRANPSKSLCEIFNEDVAQTTSKTTKARWLPRFSALVASIVKRALDVQFSESGIRDIEREIIRNSKLAHIVHQTINELIPARQVTNGPEGPIPGPVIGVNALIICSALNEESCVFSKATRQIDSDLIPAFARYLSRLLIDIDWSNLPATISVVFPLFLISWAVRKPFHELCELLGLLNLARLQLDVTAQLDRAEMRWQIATRNWTGMTKAEINLAKTQLHEDVQIILGDLRRLCLDQSEAASMTTEVSASEHQELDRSPASQNSECVGEAGSIASEEEPFFTLHQPSIDSGYLSNAASQQMRSTAPVVSSSGAFSCTDLLYSRHNAPKDSAASTDEAEDGEGSVREAVGQKRPQIGVHATSKRRRQSTSGTVEDSEDLENLEDSDTGVKPSNADRAMRSLRNTDVVAPTTNVSTDPPQGEPLQELAGVQDIPDFSVGSGMAFDDFEEFWTGSGMDLDNVNLATPTVLPDLLRAEQPCESSPLVAGSENERQAE